MQYSWTLHRLALTITGVSEDLTASNMKVTRIGDNVDDYVPPKRMFLRRNSS
jgi:hypothetical protein